ncbi:ATP-binding protein [Dactylosporangium cerinum]
MHGRDEELATVERLLAEARAGRGAALVIRGDAGIGKTMLLAAAQQAAAGAGMAVLQANGAEAESALPFAGLHQLLGPLLGDLGALTPRLQRTLRSAFGQDDERPDWFTVGLAVLELLGDRAARTPLLLVAEDAHWLDPETLNVLVFVARRLAGEPIAAVLAVRTQPVGVLTGTGLGQLTLGDLDDGAAARVLADHAPHLSPPARDWVLAQAAGNPLALVELPRSIQAQVELPSELVPLSERLETAFAGRFAQLPAGTRAAVAAFSADPNCPVPTLLAAARATTGTAVTPAAFQPAIDAGLLQVQGRRLRFRHPLMRSAVYRCVTEFDRLTIHAVLADALADDPDRRAWHRSAATLGPDEEACAELEAAAVRALGRGAVRAAVGGLGRAAELTGSPQRRSALLLQAAELASTEDLGLAAGLVGRVELLAGAADRARLALVRDTIEPAGVADAARIHRLCDHAAEAHAAGETGLAALLCWRASLCCWFAGLPDAVGARITAVLGTLGLPADEPIGLAIQAHAQPDALGPGVLHQLPRLVPDRADADGMRYLGSAALTLGDFPSAASFMSTAAANYRAQGRATLLTRPLAVAGYVRLWLGGWPAVRADLEEAEALAEETGDPFWMVTARASRAMHDALTGNHAAALNLADDITASPATAGVRAAAGAAQHARGIVANAEGRHDEALDLLLRMYAPADPAYQPDMHGWALPDLADAAARTGRPGEARGIVEAAGERAARLPSPMLLRCHAYASAVLAVADGADAGAAFDRARAMDLAAWPVHRARLDLAYGTWLRRRKRILESRVPLRAARDGFDTLGAVAWGRLAREELRAAGEESTSRAVPQRERLTAQELQTAMLAAAGLSNREIGQRLFVSHRTVSSHLYRIFPKLGITGRSQLRDALEALAQTT